MPKPYIGRFAPTPSGGLHLGSLVTAVASYLDARSTNGKWLVRIEDVDLSRQVAGAADNILHTLEAYGFEWDDEVIYQSQRLENYERITQQLLNQGLAYACTCSRKKLEKYLIYPNFCRDAQKPIQEAAIRIRVPKLVYAFTDRVQGIFKQHLGRDVGDFIIKRQDGFFAYQLAVVLDDALQGITDIVRGADLLDSTPRQLYLQELLGFSTPRYLHVPILMDDKGNKLSKTQCSPMLPSAEVARSLIKVLQLLGQYPEQNLYQATPQEILQYAINRWNADFVPKKSQIAIVL